MSEIIQRSEEWYAIRAGRATASRFSDVMAKIKTGEAATRRNYRYQLLSERLTGVPQESGFINAAMQWGIENEPLARVAYEAANGVVVDEVGFVQHPALMAGCSPDGLVGSDGAVEFKCPNTATHILWMEAGVLPSEHAPQVYGQLWITGREWVDFVSYDPRLPEHLQLFTVHVPRDDERIKEVEEAVTRFLDEVDEQYSRLMRSAA